MLLLSQNEEQRSGLESRTVKGTTGQKQVLSPIAISARLRGGTSAHPGLPSL